MDVNVKRMYISQKYMVCTKLLLVSTVSDSRGDPFCLLIKHESQMLYSRFFRFPALNETH